MMRITNRMMTNNMLSNINKNKQNMSKLEEQYSTGKKIQKPSDDPIVTVRALKFRTNLSEIEQYYDKNIPDAMSWMDVTEGALNTINSIVKQINTYCVQGSTDSLTATNRSSIVQKLVELKNQIYQEGNTNYAGRYVFTGYKTDSSLTFMSQSDNLQYDIKENFTGN
jgi:flagellar hook-associated protein 3 FlgL